MLLRLRIFPLKLFSQALLFSTTVQHPSSWHKRATMLRQQVRPHQPRAFSGQRWKALRVAGPPRRARATRVHTAAGEDAVVLAEAAPIVVAEPAPIVEVQAAPVVVAEAAPIAVDASTTGYDNAVPSTPSDSNSNSAVPSTPSASTADSNGSSDADSAAADSAAAAARRSEAKLALLQAIAGLNRGALASDLDKARVERLVMQLEATGGPASCPEDLEGTWELLYSNVEAFRASPFFLAFANGLVQDEALADAIFSFTDAIPGATIGSAYQTISSLAAGGTLVSKVDMSVFPGFKGTVVTTSRAYPEPPSAPTRLALLVEATRVEGSNFSPWLDGVAVPVEQLMERVRGAGATKTEYDIRFVDEQLRVTRAGRQLMVHRRVGA